jgi:Mycothiol maleylpyruvate isomerase N-terminal domain
MAALVDGADPWRRRSSGGWSVAGYVCHVGDSIRVWAERVAAAALGDDRPAPYDQDVLATARGYDDTSVVAALWNLERSVEDWRAAFSLAGGKPVLLRHVELGDLDLDDVVRIRAHDVVHHGWDVRSILAC